MFTDHFLADLSCGRPAAAPAPGFHRHRSLDACSLGLGANIAIFTLVRATMFQQLPVGGPDELVRLGDNDNCCVNSGLQTTCSLFSYSAYLHLRDRVPEIASLAAFQASSLQVGVRRVGTAVTESLPGEFVSGNYFTTFGVAPVAGGCSIPATIDPAPSRCSSSAIERGDCASVVIARSSALHSSYSVSQ